MTVMVVCRQADLALNDKIAARSALGLGRLAN